MFVINGKMTNQPGTEPTTTVAAILPGSVQMLSSMWKEPCRHSGVRSPSEEETEVRFRVCIQSAKLKMSFLIRINCLQTSDSLL